MLKDILPYYERELIYLRQLAKRFAEEYPGVAERLQLDGEVCEDPHVERLIESFAFLTSRIHKKLEDDYPEITESMLGIVYPHLVRPIPSMSIVEFVVDREAELTTKQVIARGTAVFAPPVKGLRCRFRTAYPVDVWPVRVADARFETMERTPFGKRMADDAAVLSLRIEATGSATFRSLGMDRIRFHINAEPPIAHALYELIFNSVNRVVIATEDSAGDPIGLSAAAIQPVGFGVHEGLLDYDPRSFIGYRLLEEYFALPEKFLFFDLDCSKVQLPDVSELRIAVVLRSFQRPERSEQLALAVDAGTFRLHCTPIVNLFPQQAEPIRLAHELFEYPVTPDRFKPWGLEVYSIDAVKKFVRTEQRESEIEYLPFYSLKHGLADTAAKTFWSATRSPSPMTNDHGTDVSISLVDLEMNPSVPSVESLSLQLTCTNRDLPAQLPFGGLEADMTVDGMPFLARIQCLRKPTATLRPPMGKGAHWRLISHLSLNHLSLVESGREALLEILNLYNWGGEAALRRMIAGITHVASKPLVSRVGPANRCAYVRGTAVELEFDEDRFVGGGVYLFACVLERFFGLYCAANTFTQLTARTKQRETELASWPPRTGELNLT